MRSRPSTEERGLDRCAVRPSRRFDQPHRAGRRHAHPVGVMPAGASRSTMRGMTKTAATPGTAAVDADRASGRMRGRRRALVWTLIVLGSLIGVGSILTTWVHRQMLDNQSWKDASARLIQNTDVQNALSVFLVNELYDNVDVASGLQQRLPDNLKPLAPPVAAALRQPATAGVKQL